MMKIDKRFQSKPDPHSPVIHINKEKIHPDHSDFKALEKLIYEIWENKWQCVNCAFYTRDNSFIQRTLYKPAPAPKQDPSRDISPQWIRIQKRFSQKQFQCISEGKVDIECIDPEFGIFKI